MRPAYEVRCHVATLMRDAAARETEMDVLRRDGGRDIDRLLSHLFEISDALDRITSAGEQPSADSVSALRRQVAEFITLEKVHAVRPVVGAVADPSQVQVIATIQDPHQAPGVITRVFHDGYVRGSRVLRRAGVEISKG